MGGAAAGGLASQLAATSIYETLTAYPGTARANPTGQAGVRRHLDAISRTDRHDGGSTTNTHRDFANRLREAVELANARLFHEAERNPRLHGMGTTATVAGILDDTLYLAQIGDSRAYLVRRGIAYQLTHDQSRVQAQIDAGLLTPEEAARSNERHIILQALGPEPAVAVDMTRQQLRRGDVVVLSTDGLHGIISAAELAALAAPEQTSAPAHHVTNAGTTTTADRATHPDNAAPPNPAKACQALIDLGNKRGGPDNITLVIMHLDGAGLAEPREDEIVGRQVIS
jgi:protein phosphatase